MRTPNSQIFWFISLILWTDKSETVALSESSLSLNSYAMPPSPYQSVKIITPSILVSLTRPTIYHNRKYNRPCYSDECTTKSFIFCIHSVFTATLRFYSTSHLFVIFQKLILIQMQLFPALISTIYAEILLPVSALIVKLVELIWKSLLMSYQQTILITKWGGGGGRIKSAWNQRSF